MKSAPLCPKLQLRPGGHGPGANWIENSSALRPGGISPRGMKYIWNIYGLYMAYMDYINGLYMDFIWIIYGLYLDYWIIYGLYLDYL